MTEYLVNRKAIIEEPSAPPSFPDRQIWARQPAETSESFQAFGIYRDMGPKRSIAKAAKQAGRNISLFVNWSSEHAWVERATEYDAYLDDIVRADRERDLQRSMQDATPVSGLNKDWVLARWRDVSDKCSTETHWSPYGALRGAELIARTQGYLQNENQPTLNLQQNFLSFVSALKELGKDALLEALPNAQPLIEGEVVESIPGDPESIQDLSLVEESLLLEIPPPVTTEQS